MILENYGYEDIIDKDMSSSSSSSSPTKGKKRSNDESHEKDKRAKTSSTILFVAGAPGKISGENDETGEITNERKSFRHFFQKPEFQNLDFIGPVRSLEGRKFTGGNGPTAKRSVGLHFASANVGRKHFLVSSSFGGRAIAQSLSGYYLQGASTKKGVETAERFPLKQGPLWETDHKHLETNPGIEYCQAISQNSIHGAILFGFPIDRNGVSRIDDLLEIPKGTKLLFVTGSKDSDHGEVLRNTVIPQLKCQATTEIHIVQGGKHNPLDCGGAKGKVAIEELITVVQKFMKDCIDA